MTISCGRCRLLLIAEQVVVVRIGTYPPRRLCPDCAEHVQLECCIRPSLNASVPLDSTPETPAQRRYP